MANRLEAVAVRKYTDRDGNEKTQYTNLGNAWPFRDREGFTLRLNAFPAPQEGEYVILLVPPREKDSKPAGKAPARQTKANFSQDLDDGIPFAPEFR